SERPSVASRQGRGQASARAREVLPYRVGFGVEAADEAGDDAALGHGAPDRSLHDELAVESAARTRRVTVDHHGRVTEQPFRIGLGGELQRALPRVDVQPQLLHPGELAAAEQADGDRVELADV